MSAAISNSYLAGLLTGRPDLSAAFSSPAHAWLNRLRADAVDRVGALTVPTTRDEEWRFTDISPLTRIPFQPTRNAPSLDAGKIEQFTLPEPGARLVFVDGVYAPELSFNNAGIVMENLAAGMARQTPATRASRTALNLTMATGDPTAAASANYTYLNHSLHG